MSGERGTCAIAPFLPGARGNFDLPARFALRVLPLHRRRPTMRVVGGPPLQAPTRTADRPGPDARSQWNEAIMNMQLMDIVLPSLARRLHRQLERYRAGELDDSQFNR